MLKDDEDTMLSPKTPKMPKTPGKSKEHKEHKERSRRHKSTAGALPPVKEPAAFRMDLDSDADEQKPGMTRKSSLTNVYEALGADFHAMNDDSGTEMAPMDRPRLRGGKPAVYTQPLGPLIVPATPKTRSQGKLFPSASAMALDLGLGESSAGARPSRLAPPSREQAHQMPRSSSLGALQKGAGSSKQAGLLPQLSASKASRPAERSTSGSKHHRAVRMWSGSGTGLVL